MFDLDKLAEKVPFLADMMQTSGDRLLLTIVFVGLGVVIGMLILMKILFASMAKADEKRLDAFYRQQDPKD